MVNNIELSIKLKPETIAKIDEIVAYSKFRQRYTKQDLPMTTEDVVKSAIDEYLNKVETIHDNVIRSSLYKLKSGLPLKNNLKRLIEESGLNQKEVSDLTGIYPGTLSHILSNRNQPSMDFFFRIWVVLGCPPIEHVFYRESE